MGLFGRLSKVGAGIVRGKLRGREDDDLDELDDDLTPAEVEPAEAAPAPAPVPRAAPTSKKRSL